MKTHILERLTTIAGRDVTIIGTMDGLDWTQPTLSGVIDFVTDEDVTDRLTEDQRSFADEQLVDEAGRTVDWLRQ